MDEFSEAGTWYWRATAGPPRAHGAAQVRRSWRASCARRGSGEAQLAGLVLEVHGPEKARDGASSASGGKGGGGLLGLGEQPLRGGACVPRKGEERTQRSPRHGGCRLGSR